MTNNPTPAKQRRPLALTLVLFFIVLSALINISAGALAIYVSDTVSTGTLPTRIITLEQDVDGLTDEADTLLGGGWVLLVGIVELVIIIGFARQKRWAWVAIMTWQALNLLIQVTSALAGGGEALSLAFSILLVLLLNQAPVRRAFGIVPQKNEPSTITPLDAFDVN